VSTKTHEESRRKKKEKNLGPSLLRDPLYDLVDFF
jgi:hypothetical protein